MSLFNKKPVEVAMGPVSKFNMTIATAFYVTQVDLTGPFLAYSQQHKRTSEVVDGCILFLYYINCESQINGGLYLGTNFCWY